MDITGALAEFERGLIVERTQAGIQAAKKRGVHLGRRPSLAPVQVDHARRSLSAQSLPVRLRARCVSEVGCVLTLTGKAAEAIQDIASGIAANRSTGNTMWTPLFLSYLARANAEIRQFNTAWTNIHEAMTAVETTKENWYEAEINRVAGEIALLPPEPDATKAEAYFARALEVARQQQVKSWELRAAMSMARLWREKGKQDEARQLLAPVYAWFTEGFDTLDLREARALLCTLAS